MGSLVAIAVSREEGLDSPGDPRFGRAPAFVLLDEDGQLLESLTNPNVEADHGAGTGTAATMLSREVGAVIAGEFGPKAYRALSAAGVAMWVAPPGKSARELATLLREGALRPMQMQEFR